MHFEEVQQLQTRATEILEDTLLAPTPFGDLKVNSSGNLFSTPALGIHPASKNTYQLAIRLAYESDLDLVKPIMREIPREKIDLRITGPIKPFKPRLTMSYITHYRAWLDGKGRRGTIGSLVRKRGGSDLLILSNHHVLASSNDAQENDPIVTFQKKNALVEKIKKILRFSQSEKYEEVAFLKEYIKLKYDDDVNLVDAAIASIKYPKIVEDYLIDKFGIFEGFHERDSFIKRADLSELSLSKRGTKTGLTQGHVTGINIVRKIDYSSTTNGDSQMCKFVDLIEITQPKRSKKLFAMPGDSGAIIFDAYDYAVALLFAGTPTGATYAIPISTVLEALDIELVLRNQINI